MIIYLQRQTQNKHKSCNLLIEQVNSMHKYIEVIISMIQ